MFDPIPLFRPYGWRLPPAVGMFRVCFSPLGEHFLSAFLLLFYSSSARRMIPGIGFVSSKFSGVEDVLEEPHL